MKQILPISILIITLLISACADDDNSNEADDGSNEDNVTATSVDNKRTDDDADVLNYGHSEKRNLNSPVDTVRDSLKSVKHEERAKEFDHSSLANFLKSQTPETQKFTIDLDKKMNFIECKNGTKILIPEKPFVDKAGKPVRGKVELSVVEYYKFSDMLVGRLSTTSGNHALETGGMIDLRATQNGEELSLGPYQTLGVEFGSEQSLLPDMTLFLANFENGGVSNWIEQDGIESLLITYNSKICGKYNLETGNPVEFDLFESIKLSDKEIDYFIQNNYPELRLDVTFYKDGSARVMHIDPMPTALSNRITEWFEELETSKSTSLYLSGEVLHFKLKYTTLPYPYGFNGYIPPDMSAYQRPIAQYMFKTRGLGWINCDRFYRDSRPKATMHVQHNLKSQGIAFVILDSYNSIMEANNIRPGQFSFNGIPIGEKGTIYTLQVEDDKIYFAKQAVSIDNKTIKLNLKEISEDEWKTNLLALD